MQILRPHSEGTHLVVRTGHQALRWIQDWKKCTGCLARWRLRLLELDFEVVHQPRTHHQAIDVMLRLPKETVGE